MAYKISGSNPENVRILVFDESDWSIESNTVVSGVYTYEVTSLASGTKSIVARNSEGELVGFGNVEAVWYGPDYITVPYSYSFEDLTNGEYTGDDLNWRGTGTVYNNAVTSYDSTWTGGLVFNTTDGDGLRSLFFFEGDFDVSIRYSTDNPYLESNSYSIYMRVYDVPAFNAGGPMFGTSLGNHLMRTQTKSNGGTWLVDSSKSTDNFEPEFRIVRSGNNLAFYDGTTALANRTISSLPTHLYLYSRAYDTTGTNNEDFFMNRIKIDSGTIKYPTRDYFNGDDDDPVDSNIWTEYDNADYATVIDNNRAKQHIPSGGVDDERCGIKITDNIPSANSDFSVWVDLSLASAPSSDWWSSFIILSFDGIDDYVYLERKYSSSVGHHFKVAYYNGSNYLSANTISTTATDFKYCLTRVGGTITAYWNISNTWYSEEYPDTYTEAIESISLTSFTRTNFPELTVYWDNFGLVYEE